MAKLSTQRRKSLSKSTFGLPSQRKYPMPDKAHAINAKARAEQQYHKGNLTVTQLHEIDAKADKIIRKAKKKS
jgi:hypothetical protein